MASRSTRFLNVGLHGTTLATRFLFIFFLAKYLDPAAVGYYGLFTATVGYSIYFVGLDFYTYASREAARTPLADVGQLLKGQAALSGLLYCLFLPISYVLLASYSGWPTFMLFFFLPLLVLEHFNQEMSRLLVALSQQLTASVVLFVRQGSWALAIIGLMHVDASNRDLRVVMLLWSLAGIAAALAAVYALHRLGVSGWRQPVDWQWVRRGVGVSTAFLIATLALRGIYTFDRYLLDALGGIEVVAAYVFFIGVAGSLQAFLDAGILSFAYPVFIKLYQEHQIALAHAKLKQTLRATVALTFCFALVSWLALPFLLHWIGKASYLNASALYPVLLLATGINAVSMVPHIALYGAGQDRPIIHSHIAAFFVFILSVLILSVYNGINAVPQALVMSFMTILIWKSVAYRHYYLTARRQ